MARPSQNRWPMVAKIKSNSKSKSTSKSKSKSKTKSKRKSNSNRKRKRKSKRNGYFHDYRGGNYVLSDRIPSLTGTATQDTN